MSTSRRSQRLFWVTAVVVVVVVLVVLVVVIVVVAVVVKVIQGCDKVIFREGHFQSPLGMCFDSSLATACCHSLSVQKRIIAEMVLV